MHNAFSGVMPASLDWRKCPPSLEQRSAQCSEQPLKLPFSIAFEQFYIQPSTVRALSNNPLLTNAFKQHIASAPSAHKPYVIFETGFGTGAHFLNIASQWKLATQGSAKHRLDYYAVEAFPLSTEDLQDIYQRLSQQFQLDNSICNALLERYPPRLPGCYQLNIAHNITLFLTFLPLSQALKELALQPDFHVNTWLLDGFDYDHSQAETHDMWSKGLLHFMAQHSRNNHTLRTHVLLRKASCGEHFQASLAHYGFVIESNLHDDNLLTARFTHKKLSPPKHGLSSDFLAGSIPTPDSPSNNAPRNSPKKIAIIGGGLAGCTMAYQLKHHKVDIFEHSSHLAAGASKMPALMALPNLSIDHNPYSQLTFHGITALHNLLLDCPDLAITVQGVHSITARQMPSDKYSLETLQDYSAIYQPRVAYHNSHQGADLEVGTSSFMSSEITALNIPAFQVDGEYFCHILTEHLEPTQLHFNHSMSVWDHAGNLLPEFSEYDHVIVCTGHNCQSLVRSDPNKASAIEFPQVSPVRGQLTAIRSLESLTRSPIHFQGHIAQRENQWIVGATFDVSRDDGCYSADDRFNLEQACGYLTELEAQINPEEETSVLEHWAGIRASSYDRFPFVGPHSQTHSGTTIWLNYGYGTRGLCLTTLMAQVISSAIDARTIPLPKDLLCRISPKRK